MASLDKTSVREEVGRLKADFEQLCREGKVASETMALFKSLFLIVELILSIFLERQTRKTNKNPSIPSSQTDHDETSLSSGRSSAKRRFSTAAVANHRSVETITVSTVDSCDICGSPLDGVECLGHERRTKFDIVFEKVVEHVDAEIKQCPECASTVKATFPADMPGPLQYGNGLKAYLVNLMIGQMMPLARTQSLTESLLGEHLSESTRSAPLPSSTKRWSPGSSKPGTTCSANRPCTWMKPVFGRRQQPLDPCPGRRQRDPQAAAPESRQGSDRGHRAPSPLWRRHYPRLLGLVFRR